MSLIFLNFSTKTLKSQEHFQQIRRRWINKGSSS